MSKRQREILRLWLSGKFWKEVADELHISGKTVSFHVTKLHRLIGSSHPAKVIKWAMDHKLE